VARVAATLLFGSITYVITSQTGQSTESTITLSVFIGGVVLVVQYLAEFERRQAAYAEEQRITLADFSRATHLFEALKGSGLSVADFERLIDSLSAINNLGSEMISDLTMGEFERLTQFVEQVRAGEATYDGEDREWLLALTRGAQGDIVATSSTMVDDEFWPSELGDRYLKAQAAAVGRGVRVRRVFLVDDLARTADAEFRELSRRQSEMKLEYRVIEVSKLTHAQQKIYKDYVVFDKRLYYQVRPPSQIGALGSQAAVMETRLSLKAYDIETGVGYFEELWKLAES
jgi:hypothetical protein